MQGFYCFTGHKLASLGLLILAGCASSTGQRTGYPAGGSQPQPPVGTVYPAPQQPAPAAPQQPRQPVPILPGDQTATIPPQKTPPNYPKSAADISGGAVVSLMKQASQARAAGQYDQASGALERAVRIEPRNYFVWSALARNYLDKKLYDNAESIALKSNSLARGNVYVELENWKIITEARQAQGDAIGALQAQGRLDEIQRNLIGS
ncbi:hypothetical protein WQQ_31960 [Hydrocarboniphaga effusa AP103]|jgi:hypothetical protein|uniref:Uncharacterized protein n=2 Tax=Nevskiaceae TaxID=568386 RepID=I7ZCL7_9GAMM|nr:hypothetical protein WQQ_31960 [Hydrocarboniphaga effusa AP103]